MIGAPETPGFLQRTKAAVLAAARTMGAFDLVAGSEWRRRRLLILCYHGVSLEDEHEWNPRLYLSRSMFRRRLELIQRRDCNVLPLDEAVQRLHSGRLPARAVAITFDDGHHDFFAVAEPILRDFDYPVTVYLTTYHVDCNIPIFALICSYMLWKARHRTVHLGDFGVARPLPLATEEDRRTVLRTLVAWVARHDLSASEKNDVAASIADRVGLDFESLCARRFLHLLNRNEVATLARAGIDFQLHSHCHRSPVSEDLYRQQISINRQIVEQITGKRPAHFCYPSGVTAPDFIPWLKAEGVISAVTTSPGLAARHHDAHLLPRLLDHAGLSEAGVDAWLSGFSAFLPVRERSQPGHGPATLVPARYTAR